MKFNKNEKELLDSAINVLTDYFNSDSMFNYSKNGYKLKTNFGNRNNNLFFENKNTKEHFGIRQNKDNTEIPFFTLRMYNNLSNLPDNERLTKFKIVVFPNNFEIFKFTDENIEEGYDLGDGKPISVENNVMNKVLPKFRLLIDLESKLDVYMNNDLKEPLAVLSEKNRLVMNLLQNVSLSNYSQYLKIVNNNLSSVGDLVPLLNQLMENKIDFLDSPETNKDLIEFKEFMQLCHDISLDKFNLDSNVKDFRIEDLELLLNDKSYEFYKEPKLKKAITNKL